MRYRVKIVKRATGYDWELQQGVKLDSLLNNDTVAGFIDWEAMGWGEGLGSEEAALKEAMNTKRLIEADREAEEAAHYVELD